MPTVDFTLEDLRAIFATKADLGRFATKSDLDQFVTKDDLGQLATKEDIRENTVKIDAKLDSIRSMLEEGARAESRRLDRVERRSLKAQIGLKRHVMETTAHGERHGR